MRFAHAFESGGGTERYLDDLDRTLLERNAMTIVRLHLTRGRPGGPIEEAVGRGRLIRVALPILPGDTPPRNGQDHSFRFRFKQKVRDWGIYNPLVWRAGGARWTAGHRLPPQPGQAIGAGKAAAGVFRTRPVHLVVLHFFGGADADEVIQEARMAGLPVAILNHYSNDRFNHLAIRKHAMLANGVAGVNGLDIPGYVRKRFVNLSDGIDTAFFHRAQARAVDHPPLQPLILLPARVVREKGQLDLVRAAALLRGSGLEVCLAFAGRVDSSGFVNELRQAISQAGLDGSVRFLGELGLAELRDWYAASAVVALPTYHHEGLPRVVIEALAMSVPVVAYASGGVPDAVVSGCTGHLLPRGDVAGLARRLGELLSSPSLRSSMGMNGRQMAETRFSLAALAARHERFYAQLVAPGRTAARRALSAPVD